MNLSSFYLWFKCFHILGIICWMAGLLYLYRLFIYHFDFGQNKEEIHSLFSLMEKRLYRYITVPAMLVSVIAGVGLILLNLSLLFQLWFQMKLASAVLMVLVTGWAGQIRKKFQSKDFNNNTSFRLRVMNEVPTLLMILIVILVVVRPF